MITQITKRIRDYNTISKTHFGSLKIRVVLRAFGHLDRRIQIF